MASPVHVSQPTPFNRNEGFFHYLAREGRVFLRWTMVISIVAIIVCMVSPGFYFLAVIPALVLLGAYTMLVFTNAVERRTDSDDSAVEGELTAGVSDVMEDHGDDDQLLPNQVEIVKRETTIGLSIVGAVLIVAFVVALIFLPWRIVALGGFVIFAYLLFIAMPLWLGWFNDDIDIETHRLDNEPQSAQAKTHETG